MAIDNCLPDYRTYTAIQCPAVRTHKGLMSTPLQMGFPRYDTDTTQGQLPLVARSPPEMKGIMRPEVFFPHSSKVDKL